MSVPEEVVSSALSAAVSAAMAVAMAVDAKAELAKLLDEWEEAQQGTTEELVSILTKISELIERETGEYHKADPDPFDDRHPGRAEPDCMLGQILRMLFRNDDFTNALLDTYIMTSRELSLNTAACRLLQNIMPGLETAVIFQEKVPIMIQRLCELQSEGLKRAENLQNLPQDSQVEGTRTSNTSTDQQDRTEEDVEEEEGRRERDGESSRKVLKASFKPSSLLGSAQKNGGCSSSSSTRLIPDFVYQASPDIASRETEDRQGGRGGKRQAVKENGRKAKQKLNFTSSSRSEEEVERSDVTDQQANSTSWSEMSSMVIGSDYRLLPLSPAMEQRLILKYLTPLGDYQELLAVFMQLDTRALLMNYIDLRLTKDVQLTFDALL
eukprot:superscaffoldBa00003875_g17870